ncbi:MAG: OmpA family protein [Mucilaginibacter polytrichastri]|nr:OmpA family protein [Mucilaginibacter polytrichastri]
MNYSTLKKSVALCAASVMIVGTLYAQQDSTATDSTTTTTTETTDSSASTSMSDSTMGATSTPKIFGGAKQFRSWFIGVHGGVLFPNLITGANDFKQSEVDFGYGIAIRKQFAPSFGVELNGMMGKAKANNDDAPNGVRFAELPFPGGVNTVRSFETKVDWDASILGIVDVAKVNFMRRNNTVSFQVIGGYGVMSYRPTVVLGNGQSIQYWNGEDSWGKGIQEQYLTAGAGIKFKLGEGTNLGFRYLMKWIDGDNFDGTYRGYPTMDKLSYASANLEFALGSSSKPSLDWVNPVALMYDELKDPTLRQEVEALKTRVSNVEQAVEDLKKDSDGDGVADQFDKCPNTPAGTVVDGSGCELKLPTDSAGTPGVYSNIQFEFDSAVLRTSSYPTLDRAAADLKANASASLQLDGYASAEGTERYNLRLSRDRGNAVKTYLVNAGVDASRVTVKANGEKNPIASNATEEGRVQNRRVEFKAKM